ncbi:MAG TPA: protein-L-isoaspartate(D-aspartate) O-methyltransferase [Candidatus Bathyarchaeia archaeon]|nr:protein-L-isoaspartate(D-aspartate) O-methyltransferase [Candidatus Bathyarchaeia archaeon]
MSDESNFNERKEQLIAYYKNAGYIDSQEAIRAFLTVPREEFIGSNPKHLAYVDRPLPIYENQTISAPHMVAMMISQNILDLHISDICLEVGGGSGYHAAVIAEMVAPTNSDKMKWGHVYSIERLGKLVKFAEENLKRTKYDNRVTVIEGDGSLGLPDKAPFDKITVACAAPGIPPPLIEQLKPGGRLVIPVASASQYYQELKVIIKRKDGSLKSETKGGVAFVPLIGKYGY